MKRYTIGLDFGTESARAVLVDVHSGETAAMAVEAYPDGVIDEHLPGDTAVLPPNYALQNPADWLSTMESTVKRVLQQAEVTKEQVAGIGIDFTSCTVLPTLTDGTPLCFLPELRQERHAWPKLWKHHGAQDEADRINALAAQRGERWLPRYGGKISSEWLFSKAFEILEDSPQIYTRMQRILEGADWIAWQLTGQPARNTCGAGYKGTWHKQDGYPGREFLHALHPGLEGLFTDKMGGPILAPGQKVGGLTETWAARLGLLPGTAVSAGMIDAHAAAIGGGVSEAGTMFLIMGTSTCHMLMAHKEVLVPGISGVVEDGIVPGLFGYEAGQAGVGDIFGWFVERGVPADYAQEAQQEGISLHTLLSRKAAVLKAGQSGLLALDWWNGCRTPLVNADLTGLVLGYNLLTRPEEIYRALIEATAFGTRLIVEVFNQGGVAVEKLCAGGGLTKNDLLLQIYADVTGMPIEIAASQQASALGAAVIGAVAGGMYPDIHSAVGRMVSPPERVIYPHVRSHQVYTEIYQEYRKLVDLFGRQPGSSMDKMLEIRNRARADI
jgi:L-ribulokinase